MSLRKVKHTLDEAVKEWETNEPSAHFLITKTHDARNDLQKYLVGTPHDDKERLDWLEKWLQQTTPELGWNSMTFGMDKSVREQLDKWMKEVPL